MSFSRIACLELAVPDLEASVDHVVRNLGLREIERVGNSAYLTCNERHHELVLTKAPTAGLAGVTLEASSPASLERLVADLDAAGLETSGIEIPGVAIAQRFLAPGDLRFDLISGMSNEEPLPPDLPAWTPRKFGHATLASDHADRLETLLLDLLGFRISDLITGTMTWYRCSADHHALAVTHHTGPGLHHYAFELEGWSSLEAFADHLARNGVELIWGPGRHGPGRNIFTYHLDPAGAIVEVFTDLQRIENEDTYVPVDWPLTSRTLNQWGPAPPDDFFDYLTPAAALERI